ncbi:MAG: hypothetical protein IKI11_00720 [Neisseriaceae bacterium]|nr:hypothetical protein [Neisseriaceae bacterium]
MDILSELETASKWSKINSYVCLLSIICSVISIIVGAFLIYAGEEFLSKGIIPENEAKEITTAFGTMYIAANVFWVAFYWICRSIFIRYKQALINAAQSFSPQSVAEVCRYQRNVFIVYGAYYLLFIAMIILVILVVILILSNLPVAVGGTAG